MRGVRIRGPGWANPLPSPRLPSPRQEGPEPSEHPKNERYWSHQEDSGHNRKQHVWEQRCRREQVTPCRVRVGLCMDGVNRGLRQAGRLSKLPVCDLQHCMVGFTVEPIPLQWGGSEGGGWAKIFW